MSFLLVFPCLAQQRPNVIYVFPDQLRNQALGFWSEEGFTNHVKFQADPVHTPHLNRFAKESVVLTSAISNFPLSSPHRGMLLTGMYPERSGIVLNCNSNRPNSSLREDVTTISDVFSDAGYDCGYIGKLHAETPTRNDPDNPGNYVESRKPAWDAYTAPENRHGFNYWYSYGTFDEHKNPHYWDTSGKRHDINEWSPIHEADKAIDYINNTHGDRDSSKPFFLMVAMNPPHNPYSSLEDCMEADYNLYKDKSITDLLIRKNVDVTLPKAKSSRYYFASITGVDREFGRILESLKDAGLEENTIVVFSSDHGETMCSQGVVDPKNSPYIESINIPFLLRYPNKISPRVDNLLLSTPDIMPTLLALAGLKREIPKEVEGSDYSSFLVADTTDLKRPISALYMQNSESDRAIDGKVYSFFPTARGIKTATHTLVFYLNRSMALDKVLFFDDENDPYQLHNLDVDAHSEVYMDLCLQFAKLLEDTNDIWYRNQVLSDIIPYN